MFVTEKVSKVFYDLFNNLDNVLKKVKLYDEYLKSFCVESIEDNMVILTVLAVERGYSEKYVLNFTLQDGTYVVTESTRYRNTERGVNKSYLSKEYDGVFKNSLKKVLMEVSKLNQPIDLIGVYEESSSRYGLNYKMNIDDMSKIIKKDNDCFELHINKSMAQENLNGIIERKDYPSLVKFIRTSRIYLENVESLRSIGSKIKNFTIGSTINIVGRVKLYNLEGVVLRGHDTYTQFKIVGYHDNKNLILEPLEDFETTTIHWGDTSSYDSVTKLKVSNCYVLESDLEKALAIDSKDLMKLVVDALSNVDQVDKSVYNL